MKRQYSGKDCKVSMFGREMDAYKIEYSVKQEKKNVHVLGDPNPYAEVVGKKECEGSIEIPQSEFIAIVASLPAGQDPLDIASFDIIVMYIDEVSRLFTVHTLKDCSFTEYGQEMEAEGEMMKVNLPLRISSVQLKPND